MIKRDQLLAMLSRDISDALKVPNDALTEKAASSSMKVIYINVIMPLLDVLESVDRPVYRQLMVNHVRQLSEEEEIPEANLEDLRKGMRVPSDP